MIKWFKELINKLTKQNTECLYNQAIKSRQEIEEAKYKENVRLVKAALPVIKRKIKVMVEKGICVNTIDGNNFESKCDMRFLVRYIEENNLFEGCRITNNCYRDIKIEFINPMEANNDR